MPSEIHHNAFNQPAQRQPFSSYRTAGFQPACSKNRTAGFQPACLENFCTCCRSPLAPPFAGRGVGGEGLSLTLFENFCTSCAQCCVGWSRHFCLLDHLFTDRQNQFQTARCAQIHQFTKAFCASGACPRTHMLAFQFHFQPPSRVRQIPSQHQRACHVPRQRSRVLQCFEHEIQWMRRRPGFPRHLIEASRSVYESGRFWIAS